MAVTQPHRFHIEIPLDVWARFKRIAKDNRRKLKEEALIAIENHVKGKPAKAARVER